MNPIDEDIQYMTIDFSQHNEDARQVWAAYHAGKPLRVPVLITSGPRIWILDPALNTQGVSWKAYLNDPDTMFDVLLRHKQYASFNIPQDVEMGIPAEGWDIWVEFGNVYEESWLGAEVIYPEGQIATTLPPFSGGNKEKVFEKGIPGPFEGFMGKIREFYEYLVDKASRSELLGKPLKIMHPVALGTDGPLTVANGIRGTQIFEDMLHDEDYYHRLMDFVSTAIIQRIQAWREYLGSDPKPARGGIADDAIQFISTRMYQEMVLPYHKRIFAALFGEGPHGMHLCGNVQRHFPTVIRALNVKDLDTGFPLNWGRLRDDVGEDVQIQGGVPVADLIANTPEQVTQQARDILGSGIMRGGRFILKEANDLAPCVPLANLEAMYQAAKTHGRYRE